METRILLVCLKFPFLTVGMFLPSRCVHLLLYYSLIYLGKKESLIYMFVYRSTNFFPICSCLLSQVCRCGGTAKIYRELKWYRHAWCWRKFFIFWQRAKQRIYARKCKKACSWQCTFCLMNVTEWNQGGPYLFDSFTHGSMILNPW